MNWSLLKAELLLSTCVDSHLVAAPLRRSCLHLFPTGCFKGSRSTNLQLIFHLLSRPAFSIFLIWLQAFCGRPCPKMFLKPKYTTPTAVPLSTSISSEGAVRLPKVDLPSINPCELFTDTSFHFMCFQQDFCVASPGSWCWSICAGTSIPKKMTFPFSQPLETSPNEHEPVGGDHRVLLPWSALLACLLLWNCTQLD